MSTGKTVTLYTRGRGVLDIVSRKFEETPKTYRRLRYGSYEIVRKDRVDTHVGRYSGSAWWTSESALRLALMRDTADALARARVSVERYDDELAQMTAAWPEEYEAMMAEGQR